MSESTHAEFTFGYDGKQEWATSVGTAPNVIRLYSYRIAPEWYSQRLIDWPQQMERLLYMFKSYQQYTIKSVSLRWVPRYGYPVDRFVQDIELSNDRPTRIMNALANSTFTCMVDQDDNGQSTQQNLDCFFQARDAPNAVTFRYSDPWTFTFKPTVYDVIAQNVGDASSNVGAQSGTLAPVNFTAPTDFKWFSTLARDSNANGVVSLNTSISSLGMKIWHYTPFNIDATAANLDIGRFTISVHFGFRYPEYRNPLGLTLGTVWNGGQGLQAAIQEENALDSLLGEGRKIRPISTEVTPITDLGVARQEAYDLSGSNLQSDAGASAIKRMRTRYSEGLGTQSDHPVLGAPVEDGPMQT